MNFNLTQICEKTYEIKLENISINEFLEKCSTDIVLKNKFFTKITINTINIKVFRDKKIIANCDDLKILEEVLNRL